MKQLIQSLLRPLGYRLQDMQKIGRDPWRDVQILLQSTPAPVCFDVGAHHGETTQGIFAHFPQATVHAFEPDPENFAALQTATRNLSRATLHPLALGDHLHQSKLLKTQFSQCNSLLPASAEMKSAAHQKIGEVAITVTTIDQFCLEHQITTVDFLKTDCQGLDLRVLKGGIKLLTGRRAQVVQCESVFNSEYEGQGWFYEILQFLTSLDYRPVSFGEPIRNAHHEIMFCDVIFKRREPANR